MSNRRRLPPQSRAALTTYLRCPDCISVAVPHGPGRVDIRHDDTCPTLAARERSGRTVEVLLLPEKGGTENDDCGQ